MAKRRTHSPAFKQQVVQEYLAGAKIYSLARRHGLSLTEIRTWADQYLYPSQGSHRCEPDACGGNGDAASTVGDYEAAAADRLNGSGAPSPPEDPD